jgi:DedD protein
MRLPFQRSKNPANERSPRAAAVDDTAAVETARTRARRRLIGAGVLLVAGVVGFPMLFETQPRPLPMDTPIEIRPRDLPAAAPAAPSMAPGPREPIPPPAPAPVLDAGAGVPAPAVPAASSATPPEEPAAPAPAAATPAAISPRAPEPQPAAAAPLAPPPPLPPATRADDGARAQALLEGKTAPAPASGRFVVQVGAYSDHAAMRSARQRVEKLGLKTYTQVVETDAGRRTRVRIGPYASRDEADAAAAKVKGAGLPASILAL